MYKSRGYFCFNPLSFFLSLLFYLKLNDITLSNLIFYLSSLISSFYCSPYIYDRNLFTIYLYRIENTSYSRIEDNNTHYAVFNTSSTIHIIQDIIIHRQYTYLIFYPFLSSIVSFFFVFFVCVYNTKSILSYTMLTG